MYNTKTDKVRLIEYIKKYKRRDLFFDKHYGARMMPIFAQAYIAVMCSHRHRPDLMMRWGMYFQDVTVPREFDFMWPLHEMKRTQDTLFTSIEKDIGFGKVFVDDYHEKYKVFDKRASLEEDVVIDDLSNEELVEHMLELIEASGKQGHRYVIDGLLGGAEHDWLVFYATKHLGREPSDEEMDILRTPTHRSFVNEYQFRLLEAAALRSGGESIDTIVEDIVRDFYWVEHNYIKADPKTIQDVRKEIEEITNAEAKYEEEKCRIDRVIKEKNSLLDSLNASPTLLAFVQFADDAVFIQDCGKQAVLRLNHFLITYMFELAKRLRFDPELIFYVMFYELKDFIKNPDAFIDTAKERQTGCLAIFDAEGCAIFTRDEFQDIDISGFFQDYSDIREANGTSVSKGMAVGPVRVILGSDQFYSFKEGDILVTNQTTPDFVPLMKSAAAIVAEQGGVTSHAAVVSRELGVPCIVGVNNAMNIFKSGEMVEVDAINGTIRLLDK
jgi:phosphohistidine swiveling domain-containing protein